MIKELFLPRLFNGCYVFATRIVGLDIGKTHISATQVYLKGKSSKVEKYIEIPIEMGNPSEYVERATQALKEVIAQLDAYDYLYSALPSSVAIFKELRVPFATHETIKRVVQFEIEPMLPFPVHSATLDFVITKQSSDQSNSEIVVAAVQNHYIEQHLQLCADAGVTPHLITLDLLAIYEIYKLSTLNATTTGAVMLVDLGMQATRIAYLHNGQLRFIRTINKGMAHYAKVAGEPINLQPAEIFEHLMRFGADKNNNPRFSQIIIDMLAAFCKEIQFTIQSFSAQTQEEMAPTLFLFGQGATFKGVVDFIAQQLQVPCKALYPSDLLDAKKFEVKPDLMLPSSSIISLSTALIPHTLDQVNLRQGPFELSTGSLFTKQLLVAAGLILLIFGSLIASTYLQMRAFSREAAASEKEALTLIKERPHLQRILQEGLKDVQEKDQLEEAKELIAQEVNKQEEMWFAFAGSARASILKYLLELTDKIDKEALGFVIENLNFNNGTMTIKAQVKDSEALKLFEKSLNESPLFRPVPEQQENNFVMKINLAKKGEGS